MSVHKLTAGSGYDYLTRQVAALDATEKGHVGLASYYTERGEAPGQWIGSGLAGLDGLAAGDPVTAQQMHALFGSGHHPLAAERLASLEAVHLTESGGRSSRRGDREAATRLGAPFKVYAGDVSPFRVEVARRVAALNTDAGLPGRRPVPAEERARVRTEVAREFFTAEHGRPPRDARELAGTIARLSRPRTTAVAGYDLTFSPVKSVSALWAIAPPDVAARIERAHQGAVADALRFIETHALYTRVGANGVRQVDVTGLVATAFTHRDSRAGDPDLHTHVAVANKIQTREPGPACDAGRGGGGGRWLSIDGRVLLKAVVAASETYNTALEARLRDDLGPQFQPRAVTSRTEAGKRPVREVVGVEPALLQAWSRRRADIDARRGGLAARFQRDHGRPPTPVETLHLAQQANLETRAAKHEPRTLAEQRATWRAEADEVLGHGGIQRMFDAVGAAAQRPGVRPAGATAWLGGAAERTLAAVQRDRATWQVWHVRAEAQRQVRAAGFSARVGEEAVEALVVEVLERRSIALVTTERTAAGQLLQEPARLQRRDGSSVYRVAGSDLYTSAAVLAAEQRLVELAGRRDGHAVDARAVDVALLEATANGTTLNAGQAALVREMAISGARVQLAIAPAGAGKRTAMRVLAAAWAEAGGNVVGLAPSAAAAAALRESTGTRTDTLAKLTWSLTQQPTDDPLAGGGATQASRPDWVREIGPGTLVVIDEAGMADTISLHAAVEYVVSRGGSVRLVGDDQQLAAIGAGGVLRDIQASHGALRLDELLRFRDRAEAAASLALREGRPEALGFYLDNDRVHVGDLTTMTEQVLQAWQHDRAMGLDAIMLAPTRELVSDLNQRARAHRLATQQGTRPTVSLAVVRLADGNEASEGDLLLTRTNDRSLRTTGTDWVKNGDRWSLTAAHDDGAVTARHLGSGRSVRLPADYVRASTELGYATTVHSAQGLSVDTMHGLVGGGDDGGRGGTLSRQELYTMLTRGRLANHVYLPVVGDGDPHTVVRPEIMCPRTATEHLEVVLARDGSPTSATTLQRDQADPAVQLGHAAARYVDALGLAAEDVAGPDVVRSVERAAVDLVPGIEEAPAWPALRAHLLLRAAGGADPAEALRAAASRGALGDAVDPAAVLDWRLDDTGLRSAGPGPLPWLPAVPARLAQDDTWGVYLTDRAARVVDLAHQVRSGGNGSPGWLPAGTAGPPPGVVVDLRVWRAAVQVDPADRRPTGPPQLQKTARTWQNALDRRVLGKSTPAWAEWGDLVQRLAPRAADDPFRTDLADRLAGLSRAGGDARALLVAAAAQGPLPDDHAAAALWWRINRDAPQDVETIVGSADKRAAVRMETLAEVLGAERAAAVGDGRWWPAIGHVVERGAQRGWPGDALLTAAAPASDEGWRPAAVDSRALLGDDGETDPGFELLWRAALLTDPDPADVLHHVPDDLPPVDLWDASPGAVPAAFEPPAPGHTTAPLGQGQRAASDPPRSSSVRRHFPPVAPVPREAPRR